MQISETARGTIQVINAEKKVKNLLKRALENSLAYSGKAKAPTSAGAVKGETVDVRPLTSSQYVPCPRFQRGRPGIRIRAAISLQKVTETFRLYLLGQAEAMEKAGKPVELTVLAPPESIDQEGQLQSLPPEGQEAILTWLNTKRGSPGLRGYRAWQWLILIGLRHGTAARLSVDRKVAARLHISFGGRGGTRQDKLESRLQALEAAGRAQAVETAKALSAAQTEMQAMRQLLQSSSSLLANVEWHGDGKDYREWVRLAQPFLAPAPPKPPPMAVTEVKPMPEPADAHEDETPQLPPITRFGELEFDLVDNPSELSMGAIPGFRLAHFPEKGGVYLCREPFNLEKGWSPSSGSGPAPKEPGMPKKGKGKAEEPKDPLRVKGDPAIPRIPEESLEALRKKFGVAPRPDSLPADKAERKAVLKSTRVPKWAISAVQADPANLALVLDGTINVETFQSKVGRAPAAKPKDAGKAQAEWQELKARFPGETLEASPRTARQKALKKAYDELRRKYGDQATLPKPRQGRSSSRGRSPRRQVSPGSSKIDATDLIAAVLSKVLAKALA